MNREAASPSSPVGRFAPTPSGSTITSVMIMIYKVFRMFGRIPTVPRKRLGFVETSIHEICGMPRYRIYPISPSRREQINPADKTIISFKIVSLIFLAFDIVSVTCISSIFLKNAVFAFLIGLP